MQKEIGLYQFDNLDVVDDAGNVIRFTLFQKNLLKQKQLLSKEPILPTLVHQKLLKFQ